MSDVFVEALMPGGEREWDAFLAELPAPPVILRRSYLNYHGDRFQDASLLLRDADRRILAVVAAAIDPLDSTVLVSHPGVTFGGMVGRVTAVPPSVGAVELVLAHVKEQGFRRMRWKSLPAAWRASVSVAEDYALFRAGAVLVRRDVSAQIPLTQAPRYSSTRRQLVRKARSSALEVSTDAERLPEFWGVLLTNLSSRHGAVPPHTEEEVRDLFSRCPDALRLRTAVLEGSVLAGSLVYAAGRTWHTQYLASTDEGRRMGALDLVIDHLVDEATSNGATVLSFGISTEDGGQVLNEGLLAYKLSFGAVTAAFDTYEIDLDGR